MKKVLILILLTGAFLRFFAVNWDNFGAFHPDERNISWAITRIQFFSQMDPKFFAYGGLPIYLYRALGEGVVRLTGNPIWLTDWGHIAVIGRHVSALLSTVSIGLMFAVGVLYFSPAIGIIAATLLTFSPWAIQQAHFETTETMLVFFLLLLLIIAKKISTKRLLLLGFVWGLSMAAKTTALLFGIIPITAIFFTHFKFFKRVKEIILVCTVAMMTFFIFSPFTLLDYQHFKESMTYESGVALGRFTVPYTLQFVHTIPFVYQLVTMVWQAGFLVFVGLGGLFVLLVTAIRLKKKEILIFLVFPLIYFGWVGMWYAKFSRYNVPFLPFLTIAAAWVCALLIKKFRLIGLTFTALLLITTLMWGLANFSVYLRPQTKFVASKWIAAHIPEGAAVYTEHWNDGLPLDLPIMPSYHRELLTVYDEPDDVTKENYYADKLANGDFILLSTRRIWATMPNLGVKYPVTSVFYKSLLNGTLGYIEVATFTSYPQLFGIQINDDSSEESIQVFDHPTVRIFQNTGHFTKTALLSILRGR